MFRLLSSFILAVTAVTAGAFPASGETPALELDGFIEPALVVNVGTGVSGIIESMKVDRGDIVRKGQVLATLDSRVEAATVRLIRKRAEMEATTNLRRARVDFATREQTRLKELFQKGIIPDFEMDTAETNLAIAQGELAEVQEQKEISALELDQAEAALERKVIRSPIDGVVVERYLAPGELAADEPLLRLAQLDPLYVEVIAPVGLLGSVKAGQTVSVFPEEPVGEKVTGKVTIVDRVLDAASGTFGIRIELSNRDLSLPAGLKCRVRFSR